jgi:hypothetical protein
MNTPGSQLRIRMIPRYSTKFEIVPELVYLAHEQLCDEKIDDKASCDTVPSSMFAAPVTV